MLGYGSCYLNEHLVGRLQDHRIDKQGIGNEHHGDEHDQTGSNHVEMTATVRIVMQHVGDQHHAHRQPEHQISTSKQRLHRDVLAS